MYTCSYASILLQLKYLSFFAGVCFPAISVETIVPSPGAPSSAKQIHHSLWGNLTMQPR